MKKRSVIDLFAGCGGLSLGIEQSGFQTCFANELNPDALATYLANRHHSVGGLKFNENPSLHARDVGELTGKRLYKMQDDLRNVGVKTGKSGDLDLLVGGPPCQGYSGIGIRRSYSVDKQDLPSNQLYKKMASLIGTLQPKIFLFENVRGLLTSRWTAVGEKGEIWRDVFGEYVKLARKYNYELRWSLVHAKNYGVPQNRPRVLLVGIRSDIASINGISSPKIDYDREAATGTAVSAGVNTRPTMTPLENDLIHCF